MKNRIDTAALFNSALSQHQTGNLPQAEALYREILQADPKHADALHLLGVIAHQQGHHRQAIPLIEKAIALAPCAAMFGNLAQVVQATGDLDGAVALFRKAIALDPCHVDSHYNLGIALHAQGKLPEAINSFLQAIAVKPDHAGAYTNLGVIAFDTGHHDDAIRCYETALALAPDSAVAHNNLGNALKEKGRHDAAIAHFKLAIALDSDYALAYNNWGNAAREQGQSALAIDLYRKTLELDPSRADIHSNLLFTLISLPNQDPDDVFAEHLRFARQFEDPLKAVWHGHSNPRDKNKRLRVGYVSGDFRDHAVAYFIEPVLASHDRSQVEIFCYYNHHQQDEATRRIAALSDHWLPCKTLSDEELAARIRQDGIDILIDLSGHTAYNRLLTFARKPAPVQMTWIGSPSTTGLSAIDYRLTDAAVDPVGTTERFHSETPLRLPFTAPFQAPAAKPPVNALPALTDGVFTFASLNNLAKVSEDVIALWAQILHALPGARLMLGNAADSAKQRLTDIFARHRIAENRLLIHPRMPLEEYLALHHRIDLALDTFPYNGGITTLHSLSMGVPVVALNGTTPTSRWGAGIMINAGLPEFVADTPDAYVRCALEFASDLTRLDRVRQSLRDGFPILHRPGRSNFIGDLEQAFRDAWIKWCDS